MILPAFTEEEQLTPAAASPPRISEAIVPASDLALPDILRMVRKRSFIVFGCLCAGLLLAVLYIVLCSPRYEAMARIEVSPAGTNSLGLDAMSSKVLSPSDPTIQLQSAVTVLEGSTVALAVISQLKMSERKDFAGSSVQAAGSSVDSLSPEVRDRLLRRFHKGLKVEIIPKTDIISVQFRAHDPKLAADVVNVIVSSYAERNFRSSYDSATQVATWLSAQMADLKVKANQAQEQLAELQKKRGLIGADETDNIVTEKLKGIDEQLTWAESDRIVKETRYRIAQSGNPELIASTVPEPTLQVLRTQQAQLRVDYARLNTKFGQGYPKLAELDSQMKQVDDAINAELHNLTERYKNEYAASSNAEKMLRSRFEEQKQKAYDLNEGAAQYAILKHEVEATQELYQTLQLKLKEAGIVAGLASANIGVVEAGQVPSEPMDPRPSMDLALGLGAGLGIGVLSALGLEALDASIRTSEEAEQITGIAALASIPQVRLKDLGTDWKTLPVAEREIQFRLVALKQPNSAAAECYRTLRTSLLYCTSGRRSQVLVVTSSLPSEGKTLTAVNCAAVLAQQGARVLLVDADLRHPSLQQTFHIAQVSGLGDLLAGTSTQSAGIFPANDLPNLSVIPSGVVPDLPAEALASERMEELIHQWRERYDYIVLDSPPVCMFTDAVVLGSRADAAVLVVRCGMTTADDARHSRDALRRANVPVAGIVVNAVDTRNQRGYYGSYPSGAGGHRPHYLAALLGRIGNAGIHQSN